MSDSKRAKAQSQGVNRAAYIDAVQQVFTVAEKHGHQPHFVITRGGERGMKVPLNPGWSYKAGNPPTQTECVDAIRDGRLLGIIPASIGRVVIDTDAGDPRALESHRPPAGYIESVSGRGAHLYYTADETLPDSMKQRNVETPSGKLTVDVIYKHPHAFIRPDRMRVLVSVINTPPSDGDFPHDLFTDKLKPSTPVDAAKTLTHYVAATGDYRNDLRRVREGGRHEALFAVCCRGGRLGRAEWKAGRIQTETDLLLRAVQWNYIFPQPLPHEEVESIVRDAFKYLPLESSGGCGRDYYTHDTESQRRRQSLAVAARNAKRKPEVKAVFTLVSQGKFPVEISRKTGVPLTTVKRWLKSPL